MFANLYPFHQPKTAMQLSFIRPNTSFLVTCLANKTNHPVRSSDQPVMHHQKICHAPPLTAFISISTSHAPPPEFTAFRPDKILP